MDTTNILNALGLSGGAIGIIATVLWTIRKVCNSKCVRKEDGHLALELSLNTHEIEAIQNNEDLKKMLNDLKKEIHSKRNIV